MSGICIRKKDSKLEIGDVIEVTMDIEYNIPQEDYETKDVICLADYEANYEVNYFYPRKSGVLEINYTVDAGFIPIFDDDIRSYLKEYFERDIEEVSEYELFDVKNEGEYQTAKIRIKALKE